MTNTWLVYDPAMAAYDLGPAHPLRPERFSLAVALTEALGLLAEDGARLASPQPATLADVERVHDRAYVEAVVQASAHPASLTLPRMGLGSPDNPVFAGMHEASLLICGGAVLGLEAVLDGRAARTFNIAGGLHHAHRARAAGFCVYNDPAVAIAAALASQPDQRIAYVDIDAHHGDGVQEAFYDDPRALTISLHEDGMHLFPGTGWADETGAGEGEGFALNVPMPPLATDACYALAMDEVVLPALRRFRPDAIVAQLGADTHHDDPLTTLGLTLTGYRSLVRALVRVAEEICSGRLAASGGGGYGTFSVVPRAWTCALAELLGEERAESLSDARIPSGWRMQAEAAAAARGERARLPELLCDDAFHLTPSQESALLAKTAASIERTRRLSPLLR